MKDPLNLFLDEIGKPALYPPKVMVMYYKELHEHMP